MNSTRRTTRLRAARMMCLAGSACTLLFATGCNVAEAVVDGVYGGISDTVSGTFSNTLLALLGANGG